MKLYPVQTERLLVVSDSVSGKWSVLFSASGRVVLPLKIQIHTLDLQWGIAFVTSHLVSSDGQRDGENIWKSPSLGSSCERQPEVLELKCAQARLKLFTTPSKPMSGWIFIPELTLAEPNAEIV